MLGRKHALYLKDAGADLILADHPASDVAELANALSLNHCFIDCLDESSIVSGVEHAATFLGGLDCAVFNSAITSEGLSKQSDNSFPEFDNYPLSLWNKAININLTGGFLFSREVGKYLQMNSSGGSLVLVSSIYGIRSPDHRLYENVPFNTFPAYSASKAGLIGLMQWLSTLWAPKNIRVNCISPGGVFNDQPDVFVKSYSARVPMMRMAGSDEISSALIFLLSDASSYCTGQNLVIDGGLSAW